MPTVSDPYLGRSQDDWELLTAAGLRFLVERARLGRPTSYTELNTVLWQRTGLERFDFDQEVGRAGMGELLGRVVAAANAKYEDFDTLMLSALVMYLDGNDAGAGFYKLAHSKGLLRRGDDRTEFWIRQQKDIYAYFAPR